MLRERKSERFRMTEQISEGRDREDARRVKKETKAGFTLRETDSLLKSLLVTLYQIQTNSRPNPTADCVMK